MNDPAIALTSNVELERVAEAARDSVTDDMISRLTETAADAMDLLDRINRSGLADALPALAEMANNGDLQRLVQLARVYTAAEDSVTDDMIGRLAETAGGGMALLDQLNRSGLERAVPVIAEMVNNGDLERVAQLARVYTAAEDSVTDDMIGRLSETVGGGLVLLDQLNRSELGRAIPALSEMVASGDLDRVIELTRVLASAEDAVTDDMVGRLAETIGEGVSVVDRLNRAGVGHLVDVLEQLEGNGALERIAASIPKMAEQMQVMEDLAACLEAAARESARQPPMRGGIGGLMQMMRDRENQEFLRFMFAFGRELRHRFVARQG